MNGFLGVERELRDREGISDVLFNLEMNYRSRVKNGKMLGFDIKPHQSHFVDTCGLGT